MSYAGLPAVDLTEIGRRLHAAWPISASALACLLAFLLDRFLALNAGVGIVYILLVFCSLLFRQARTAFVFATIATILAIIGCLGKTTGDGGVSIVLTKRLLLIGAIWFVATIIYQSLESERHFEREKFKLRTVLNHAIDGLIAIDEGGTIALFNPSSERIFGYRSQDVVGRNIASLMSPPDENGFLIDYLSLHAQPAAGVSPRLVIARHKDGSTFPMELLLSAFVHEQGRYVPGILRDVSARKQGEERRALLAAIVASSEDAIVSTTLQGVITSWNASAERLLGYSATDSIGKHLNFVIPPEKLAEEQDILHRLQHGEEIHSLETLRRRKNGEIVCVSLTVSPVRNSAGDIVGASKIMRDISVQKQAETKLLQYNQALERSNKELDDFAYIASHDLKEPLRGVFNNATFLLEDYQDKLDEKGQNRLRRLCFLSKRMEQLINDLLYFSRLGRQELAIQPTDVTAVIDDIVLMLDGTLKEHNANVTIKGVLPTAICDKSSVREILLNLITNAIKYNNKEIKTVEIGYIDELKTSFGIEKQIFYVKDNGIGIEQKFYEDIFRIFKRLNEEDDSRKGTGVGLTFVRKILDRHGGRIWVDSSPGAGATFYFTLAQGAADAAA